MRIKAIKKNEREDSPSRVKVPHIGPRPRSNKPSCGGRRRVRKR